MDMGFVRMVQKCQQIDRFVLEDMIKRQSVAEHSFNVALMAWSFAKWSNGAGITDFEEKEVLLRGLLHDAPETLTGDLNYWVKQEPGVKELWTKVEKNLAERELSYDHWSFRDAALDNMLCPPDEDMCRLIKMCDYLDFTIFCRKEYDLGNKKALRLIEYGLEIMDKYTDKFWLNEGSPVKPLVYSLYPVTEGDNPWVNCC